MRLALAIAAAWIAVAPGIADAQRSAAEQPRYIDQNGQEWRLRSGPNGQVWMPLARDYRTCVEHGKQLGYSEARSIEFCDKRRANGKVY